jgi:CheY-like chemotaxis protein
MINSILLVDDEDLFHMVFEDACSVLDISLSLQCVESSDRAEQFFTKWMDNQSQKPECMFVDLNIVGSSFDGIELIRKLRDNFGYEIVAGMISSSSDPTEQARAKEAGAQFWIVKSDQIEPRLQAFKNDFAEHKLNSLPFQVYE